MRALSPCCLLLALACAPQLEPSAFGAGYSPQGGTFDAAAACASFRTLTAADARTESTAGRHYLESDPAKYYPISMEGDVPAMLKKAARLAFQLAALGQSDQSRADIKLALVSLVMEEKTTRNSRYSATLVLDAQVLNRDTQQVAWQGRKSGQGENYGREGDAINYQETVSRALEAALAALLHDPAFGSALCHPDRTSPAP